MAIVPNTVRISGETDHDIGNLAAGVAIVPGMLVEQYPFATNVNRWRPHTTAAGMQSRFVALDSPGWNHSLTATAPVYAIGDVVPVWPMEIGDQAWMIIPSGQDIANADFLQSNGDGKLKEATATTAAANVAIFQAVPPGAPGAVVVDTRVRVQRVA